MNVRPLLSIDDRGCFASSDEYEKRAVSKGRGKVDVTLIQTRQARAFCNAAQTARPKRASAKKAILSSHTAVARERMCICLNSEVPKKYHSPKTNKARVRNASEGLARSERSRIRDARDEAYSMLSKGFFAKE